MVENSTEYVVLHGDCLEVMKDIPDGCIDSIITDPPYGLSKEPDIAEVLTHWLAGDDYKHTGGGFMGKSWDSFVPGPSVWRECLRVLKPGGTLLCFAGSRTQDLMGMSLRLAGFSLRDTIMWLYGSGFPKATDISKQLQKKSGKDPKVIGQAKHGACNKPNGSTFSDDSYEWKRHFDITEPTDEAAQLWNGWKSHGLKPAYEPILVAMKPNEGTYANNALVHGVSGLNIDGGRIESNSPRPKREVHALRDNVEYQGNALAGRKDQSLQSSKAVGTTTQGRFPANIILDEEAGRMLDEQTGLLQSGDAPKKRNSSVFKNCYGDFQGNPICPDARSANKGGASRFFYCAKASKKERNAGCVGLEEVAGFEYGSIKKSEGRTGINTPRANHHPTVKPLALMEYLCTLTKTPTGGLVLDPYAGSGTTGVACIKTGRDCVLIEKEPTYWPIIDKRIAEAYKTTGIK
jgi:site-specific DNA-methyltransferase (adenine-specific)